MSTFFILFKLLEPNTQCSQTVFHFFGDEAWTNFNTLLMKYRKWITTIQTKRWLTNEYRKTLAHVIRLTF